MSNRKTIADVKIGDRVESGRNGKGLVSSVTKRTIEVTFEKGVKIKNTYKTSDAYFYESDF